MVEVIQSGLCKCVALRLLLELSECVCVWFWCVPGQLLKQSLQLVAYQFDQATFNIGVGHIDHEDVGRRIRRFVVL